MNLDDNPRSYNYAVVGELAVLLDEGEDLALFLKRALFDSVQTRQTKVKVCMKNGMDSITKLCRARYQPRQLPGRLMAHQSWSFREIVNNPRLPPWQHWDVDILIDSFRWIYTATGGCGAKSLFESFPIPQLQVPYNHDPWKTPDWHQEYYRQRYVYLWQRKRAPDTPLEQINDMNLGTPGISYRHRDLMIQDFETRGVVSDSHVYAKHFQECGQCKWCGPRRKSLEGSSDREWSRRDPFVVEQPASGATRNMLTLINDQLADLMSRAPGQSATGCWPQALALEHMALHLELSDLRTEVLLSVYPKRGVEKKVFPLIRKWQKVRSRCETSAFDVPQECVTVQFWKAMPSVGLSNTVLRASETHKLNISRQSIREELGI